MRVIKKGGKVYRYLYKSKRVDGKVKSIYVGREEMKSRKSPKTKINKVLVGKKHISKKVMPTRKDDKWIVDRIIEFNKLMEESMNFLIANKIDSAASHYNKLLSVYNELSNHIGDEEKLKLYDKTKQIYDRIQELNL